MDLVGSTAFKARFGEHREEKEANPFWVTQIRHFYREFPKFVGHRFAKAVENGDGQHVYDNAPPTTWKTIGDEIIFCVRLYSLEHLSCCVTAFLRALGDYGSHLDAAGKFLDVKGAGWVAAFPSPNVTVEITGQKEGNSTTTDLIEEAYELRADNAPSDFDFLGKEIDSGFRAAKFAAADKFIASIELAWLLAEAAHSDVFSAQFSYHGRQTLKGVIGDRPYPIVTLDAERSIARKEVKKRERAVTKEVDAEPMHLRDFLRSFMSDERIDYPILQRNSDSRTESQWPQCYQDFRLAWEAAAKEYSERSASEEASEENEDGDGTTELPASINEALDKAVADVESEKI